MKQTKEIEQFFWYLKTVFAFNPLENVTIEICFDSSIEKLKRVTDIPFS